MLEEFPRRLEARRGFSLAYRGKTLLSLMDPIGQAERLAGALPVKERTLYLCPSPLYGYGIPVLLERLGPGSAILCVETDEKLMEIATQSLGPLLESLQGQSPGDRPLALVRTKSPAAICALVREFWGSRAFRRVEPVRLTGGWRLDAPAYEDLAEALIRDIARTWGNAMTLVKLGRRYIWNALRNLSLIPQALPLSILNFGNRPLLILGAGPSLDEVLPGLVKFFGLAALADPADRPFGIICADTALPILYDREIRPDLAVALESQIWNLRDFIGLGGWQIPLAMDLSAYPATTHILGGPVFLFSTPWTDLRLFDRLETAGLLPESLPPLGSVGLTAAALARRLSTGPLVTAGLDFSFTADCYHARSSPGHRDRLGRQTRLFSLLNVEAAFRRGVEVVVSKSGLPVRTDPALKNYRDLFEGEFARDRRFHDIAGPGLPLGLETLSPEEAFTLLKGTAGDWGSGNRRGTKDPAERADKEGRLKIFIEHERESLAILRDILTGERSDPAEPLEALLDRNDYLWAHFPECAAAGGRHPPVTDISFLKRVRVEIEPALKRLMNLTGLV